MGEPQLYPKNSELRNAWFSQTSASHNGSVVYMDPSGKKEIVVTVISREPEPRSAHKDLKFLGPINYHSYVRGALYI